MTIIENKTENTWVPGIVSFHNMTVVNWLAKTSFEYKSGSQTSGGRHLQLLQTGRRHQSGPEAQCMEEAPKNTGVQF